MPLFDETDQLPPLTAAISKQWRHNNRNPLPSSGALEELLRGFRTLEDRVTELEGKQ